MKKYHLEGNICEDCGEKFTNPGSLKKHKIALHTQYPKDCEDCGVSCMTSTDYMKHFKEEHDVGDLSARSYCLWYCSARGA